MELQSLQRIFNIYYPNYFMENDISKLSVLELKALAYDHLAQVQGLQNNLAVINQEIAKKSTPVKEEEKVSPESDVPKE